MHLLLKRVIIVVLLNIFYFVRFGLNSSIEFVDSQESDCFTPQNQNGVCINIKQCPPLVAILKKPRPFSPDDMKLLLDSACGYEGRTPRVCCPLSTPQTSQDPPDVSNHPNLHKINDDNCGSTAIDKIVGGNKTSLFEYPWMALIAYRQDNKLSFRCGGTLISDNYILTAAHCISNLKSDMTLAGVRLGEYDIDKKRDCQILSGVNQCADPVQDFIIDEVITHPEYSPTTFANDIGLIKIRGTPNLKANNVKRICLPIDEFRFFNENIGIVAGWGVTETGRSSSVLLKVRVPIVPNEQCAKTYQKRATITNKHVCAGGSMGQDSCSGDSGGPLMYFADYKTGVFIQEGVVSFGPSAPFCGSEGNPGVYTSVPHYMDWILDNLK